MRLLHTSDFHIGVSKNRLNRRVDHEHVIAQIKALAIDEKVDAILITGDLFDVTEPAVEDLLYAWSVLTELSLIAWVIVLCGNHDSAKLFEFIRSILGERLRIRLVDPASLRAHEKSIIALPTADGEVLKIGSVPFIKSSTAIRELFAEDAHPERATVHYADLVGDVEAKVATWLNTDYDIKHDVRIFAAHLLVDGALVSGSERALHVEREFATHASALPTRADYIALGHMHKPQAINERARYAGSPIQIDFGECDDQKSVMIISGKPGRMLKQEERFLDVGRRLVKINTTLDDLRASRDSFAGTISKVIIELALPVNDLDGQVREILQGLSHVVSVKPHYPRAEGEIVLNSGVEGAEATLSEMYAGYLAAGEPIGDPTRVAGYFDTLLAHNNASSDPLPLAQLDGTFQ